jgi:hypothetical protein
MNSPIKPPGSVPTDAVGSAEIDEAAPKEASTADVSPAAAADWKAQVDAVESAASSEIDVGDPAPAEQLIDRLVADALAAPDVATLNAAERAQLEADLRTNLAHDPTLRALSEDMHRGT